MLRVECAAHPGPMIGQDSLRTETTLLLLAPNQTRLPAGWPCGHPPQHHLPRPTELPQLILRLQSEGQSHGTTAFWQFGEVGKQVKGLKPRFD